jgi:NTP pyrophosphatase (non-canonical NTP hydrolase)
MGAEIHQIAEDHGWWAEPRTFGDIIALIHSEASEALEEFRTGHEADDLYMGDDEKPEGVPSEFADIIIRVLDACYQFGIDIDEAMAVKMGYNRTRPFRHGGKVL